MSATVRVGAAVSGSVKRWIALPPNCGLPSVEARNAVPGLPYIMAGWRVNARLPLGSLMLLKVVTLSVELPVKRPPSWRAQAEVLSVPSLAEGGRLAESRSKLLLTPRV